MSPADRPAITTANQKVWTRAFSLGNLLAMSSENHRVSTYFPAWWLPAVTVAFGLASVGVLRVWVEVDSDLLVIVPLAAAFAVWNALKIRLSPEGVKLNGRTTAWTDLRVHSGRFGESLRSVEDGRRRRDRADIFLPLYERAWRSSRLGEDIGKWAPHLLT